MYMLGNQVLERLRNSQEGKRNWESGKNVQKKVLSMHVCMCA